MVEPSSRCVGLAAFLLACAPAASPGSAVPENRTQPVATPPVAETCISSPGERGAIAVCNLELPGSFRVKNESGGRLEVLARVEVQAEDENQRWQSTRALVYLDPECRPEPPTYRCVTLEPGTVVQPHPWYGFSCSGQCRRHCPGNHFMRGWWLRFVVSSCDGLDRYLGPPFRLGEYEDAPF
jgi:hypothetical protein